MSHSSSSAGSGALLRVVIVGHVDHGKSTLTGRMLADAGALPDGKLAAIRASCEKRGVPFEYAFVLDALQAERDQNITIDVSQVWLTRGARPTVIIDAPGHREFLKNMVTGASTADAALLLVAADEGVREQTKRHATLLSLLGIKQVVVVVTKLDRTLDANGAFDHAVFTSIERELREFLGALGIVPRTFIPVAARDGDNIATTSARAPWYRGPTVLGVLDQLERARRPEKQPLRFFVQDVYRFDARRILAGRIESGSVRVGDRVRFEPGARTAVVASIEQWPSPRERADAIAASGVHASVGRELAPAASARAIAGDSIGVTLTEQIFVERGHVASHAEDGASGPHVTKKIRARIFWMGKRPLELEQRVKLRVCTHEADVRLAAIERIVDASTLDSAPVSSRAFIQKDDVADIVLEARAPFPIDLLDSALASSSRFVLVQGYDVAGGGLVLTDLSDAIAAKSGAVSADERASRNGHRGAVVQLHESDAQLAADLERALFERGVSAVLTDSESAPAFARVGLVALTARGAPREHAPALQLHARGDVRALVDDVLAHTRIDRRSHG